MQFMWLENARSVIQMCDMLCISVVIYLLEVKLLSCLRPNGS